MSYSAKYAFAGSARVQGGTIVPFEVQDMEVPVGSVVKKRRKRMSKKKHRKLLRKTRHQRRNKK